MVKIKYGLLNEDLLDSAKLEMQNLLLKSLSFVRGVDKMNAECDFEIEITQDRMTALPEEEDKLAFQVRQLQHQKDENNKKYEEQLRTIDYLQMRIEEIDQIKDDKTDKEVDRDGWR